MSAPVLMVWPSVKRLGTKIERTARGTYTGVANRGAEPDCVGDLIEGYTFSERVPFLLGHDAARPALGDAYPRAEGAVLYADLALLPPGSTKDADEARAVIESGIGELSIGFKPLKEPKANAHGGLTFPLIKVNEVSLVGAGCSYGSGIGKHLQKDAPLYLVDPAMLARVAAEGVALGVRHAVNAALCKCAGKCECSTPRYMVRPEDLARAAVEGVCAAVRAEIAFAKGSLDGEPPRVSRERKFC